MIKMFTLAKFRQPLLFANFSCAFFCLRIILNPVEQTLGPPLFNVSPAHVSVLFALSGKRLYHCLGTTSIFNLQMSWDINRKTYSTCFVRLLKTWAICFPKMCDLDLSSDFLSLLLGRFCLLWSKIVSLTVCQFNRFT